MQSIHKWGGSIRRAFLFGFQCPILEGYRGGFEKQGEASSPRWPGKELRPMAGSIRSRPRISTEPEKRCLRLINRRNNSLHDACTDPERPADLEDSIALCPQVLDL